LHKQLRAVDNDKPLKCAGFQEAGERGQRCAGEMHLVECERGEWASNRQVTQCVQHGGCELNILQSELRECLVRGGSLDQSYCVHMTVPEVLSREGTKS
jgi:hypothetical protein